jgi:hypothetical protein
MNEPLVKEPLWRTALNWGTTIYFLLIPGIVILYGVAGLPAIEPARAAFVSSFHYAITAIVATLVGLNSWDKHVVRNGIKK